MDEHVDNDFFKVLETLKIISIAQGTDLWMARGAKRKVREIDE